MPPELQLLVIVIAFIGFWAIVIRPARNAQRRTVQLQQALEVGDRVIISAGIFGTVATIDDDRVGLEIAPGTTITVARQAVVRRIEDETAADDPGTGHDAVSPAETRADTEE
ncbi:MAG TPA: preprotein translocase subunit YajC [Marmoricola sp.]|jgi:preprotein translocase subunit YajC|nr:preprotein translocase subunit YajC [Marmoricola sp.]